MAAEVENEVSTRLLTTGHSNVGIDQFISLLQRHDVTAVADVRSRPASHYLPHFNKEPLRQSLAAAGIAYRFLGAALGARPDDPACYDQGTALYARIARTGAFQQGLARLRQGMVTQRIALLCAEKDPRPATCRTPDP